ncbi:MAG: hypothetical protein A3C12_03260 [Candidatus Sungbacteria bacterium RIFCSPHIGHO2_02_FULL_49_20]|uniref:Uncharacterized protein n=1 Tax=Candidatus Sungbacteria bacterium RIFCSPHIGHO2_02_FULL_49_20 TaxID=1802272 RepID=A0A1G2KSY0_9BACT|nr:MAG: hypothetical protein A3C12_03260 [Candidatus Sungbacteria bacterium RIFCSPHIGHO2_02_FULL_49_20]
MKAKDDCFKHILARWGMGEVVLAPRQISTSAAGFIDGWKTSLAESGLFPPASRGRHETSRNCGDGARWGMELNK